ncbi:carboxylesterase/lipase family protein [Saccharothrix xinjiangensis]|uniref:Carboxylic ester hydrolase n=1 Tax=Saccharothrix xinjiangensis TaxID=204798 RepID=A0ABV9XZS4_9PSEU
MTDRPTVHTARGPVVGRRAGDVLRFAGIPFARPRRFRPPEDVRPWREPRDAGGFGPDAPQPAGSSLDGLVGAPTRPWDEDDCLTVNVWTPAADAGRRPVLVWLHGGGFLSGSGSEPWYDGTRTAAAHDVVLVTLNYRLGVFGFLRLAGLLDGDHAASGNTGLLDQLAGLRWVRDNVEAFGGDPGNVTLFGQSAGASSAAALLAAPDARGLFAKVVIQSGGVLEPNGAEEAESVADRFLRSAGLDRSTAAELLTAPAEQVLRRQAAFCATTMPDKLGGQLFKPVVDGDLLPTGLLDAVRAGRTAAVPLVVGANRDDARTATGVGPPRPVLEHVVGALLTGLGHPVRETLADYAAPGRDPLVDVMTDWVFHRPATELADAHARAGGAVWAYRFDWCPDPAERPLGACHSMELPFVFDALDHLGATDLYGSAPPRHLARRVNGAWARFARTGDPDPGAWPRYGEDRVTMVFDDESRAVADPNGAAHGRLWRVAVGGDR